MSCGVSITITWQFKEIGCCFLLIQKPKNYWDFLAFCFRVFLKKSMLRSGHINVGTRWVGILGLSPIVGLYSYPWWQIGHYSASITECSRVCLAGRTLCLCTLSSARPVWLPSDATPAPPCPKPLHDAYMALLCHPSEGWAHAQTCA